AEIEPQLPQQPAPYAPAPRRQMKRALSEVRTVPRACTHREQALRIKLIERNRSHTPMGIESSRPRPVTASRDRVDDLGSVVPAPWGFLHGGSLATPAMTRRSRGVGGLNSHPFRFESTAAHRLDLADDHHLALPADRAARPRRCICLVVLLGRL